MSAPTALPGTPGSPIPIPGSPPGPGGTPPRQPGGVSPSVLQRLGGFIGGLTPLLTVGGGPGSTSGNVGATLINAAGAAIGLTPIVGPGGFIAPNFAGSGITRARGQAAQQIIGEDPVFSVLAGLRRDMGGVPFAEQIREQAGPRVSEQIADYLQAVVGALSRNASTIGLAAPLFVRTFGPATTDIAAIIRALRGTLRGIPRPELPATAPIGTGPGTTPPAPGGDDMGFFGFAEQEGSRGGFFEDIIGTIGDVGDVFRDVAGGIGDIFEGISDIDEAFGGLDFADVFDFFSDEEEKKGTGAPPGGNGMPQDTGTGAGGNGAGMNGRAGASCGTPFKPSCNGTRLTAQAFSIAKPDGGEEWFRPAGRPVLFSKDLSIEKRVQKLARRARRKGR